MAFTWIPFYKEFSRKLLQFKDNRTPLVNWIYDNLERSYIKHLKDDVAGKRVPDIDPFTVFSIINRGITEYKRRDICEKFKDFLQISSPVPHDFDGVPIMNNQLSNFMAFEQDRKEGDIERLWRVFIDAVEDRDIQKSYDALNGQYLIKYILTMGLFWIRPDRYLGLDGHNRAMLTSLGVATFSGKFVTYEEYEGIMKRLDEKMNYKHLVDTEYADFSHTAYLKSLEGRKEKQSSPKDGIAYWTYSPGANASEWERCVEEGIMCLGWDELGDYTQYSSPEEVREALKEGGDINGSAKNSVLAVWQFANELKPGDIIFAKKGRNKIIGRGVVESDYGFDDSRENFKHFRKVRWTNIGEKPIEDAVAMKTLTNVTRYKDYVQKLNQLFDGESGGVSESEETYGAENPQPTQENLEKYSKEDFLNEVYVNADDYDKLVNLLLRKKNLILQGAPGVGKTFAAKRLAYAMMGVKDESRVKQVQFHQNYSYEDFVMGYKPNGQGGFELKEGIFYNFCKCALDNPEKDYFFIIDEINRGNLSKIFGELLMLIENDYRGKSIQLAYKDDEFSVPTNLYIIGMMNTADRSLAMIDYALRRRFSFFEMTPGFENPTFKKEMQGKADERLDKLVNAIIDLNKVIKDDDSLGSGFCIGHSYLCNLGASYSLENIVEYDIIPMLREYWFDNDERFNQQALNLRNALQ